MTDFATELFWEEEKQPVLPAPAHRREGQQENTNTHAATPESQAERLQRLAGNAALTREAEEAQAAKKHLAEAARRPESVPTAARAKAETAKPETMRKDEARAKPTAAPAASPTARHAAAETPAADTAAAALAQRLSEATKAADARAVALAQVLASFESDAGKADLLALAQLTEAAPPEIAEATAHALALAVVRADPAQRAAIAARIKAELGDRRDLRLARLLADRLAWLVVASTRPAPPPPPPPAPPA